MSICTIIKADQAHSVSTMANFVQVVKIDLEYAVLDK